MRVTVCQLDTSPAGHPAALAALGDHVREERPDLVLLPELGLSGWLPATDRVEPAAWRDAITVHTERLDELGGLAPAFAGTRPIERDGRFHNAAYTLEAGRLSDVHLKRYLPDEPGYWEATWYTAGPTSFEPFDVAGARAGVQICTEMWFFEHAREYARAGVQLLLAPRATPHESRDKWLAGGRAAAVSAGAWCLSSNHWIPGGGPIDHGGLGWVVDPDGEVVATTDDDTPFVTVDVDLAAADEAKKTYPRYVV